MNWDKANKYVGVQGVLALLVTIALLAMIFLAVAVPAQLWTLLGLSWGFYFAKNGPEIRADVRKPR